MGTHPRFDGLSIGGCARPKPHPLANVLFVIPGETSLQIIRPSGVDGDAEALSHVPDDGPWDVVPRGRKAAFPLAVLQEDGTPESLRRAFLGQERVFLGPHREMLVKLLWGEMLAHTVLIVGQGGCHKRRVVAHQVTIRSRAGGNRQQCATSHATIKVPQTTVQGGLWHPGRTTSCGWGMHGSLRQINGSTCNGMRCCRVAV